MATRSKTYKLSNEKEVTILRDSQLNLIVITDSHNLGPEWLNIHHKKGVYTVSYLLGSKEETMSPIARYLAPFIFKIESKPTSNGSSDIPEGGDSDNQIQTADIDVDPFALLPDDEKEITMSISLRDASMKIVKELASSIEKDDLDAIPVQRPSLEQYLS